MKKILLAVTVLIVIAWLASLFLESPSTLPVNVDNSVKPKDETSLRVTPAGKFVGFADEYNTQAWLGIPFATAPEGDRRWRAPQQAPASTGTLEALSYQSPCVQFWNPLAGVEGEAGQIVGSEDCLYLNIWAPRFAQQALPAGDQRLPVMVWIHGGGNTIGTANTYQGHHLAGDQKVIFVALNYRLGILGWLGSDILRNTSTTPEDASGNFAVLDMIAGLKWVRDNISAFGGDPENVTIFGESAGGRDVYALLGSPLANGLFDKAIVQSGSVQTTPLTVAENFTDEAQPGMNLSSKELINAVLIHTARAGDREAAKQLMRSMPDENLSAFMREQSVQDLFSVIEPSPFGMYFTPQNLRDGHVLPLDSLLQRFQNIENYNSVPLILGTNRDESKIFMAQNPEFVSQWFGVIPHIKDEAAYNSTAAYLSDQWKALSVDEPALILSETQGDVYAYRFDWDESPSSWMVDLPTLIGAGHGLEIAYVMGDFNGGISIPFLLTEENEPGRMALSESMMNYWGAFAHSGKPGQGRDGEQVPWTAWDNTGDKMIIFDTTAGGGIRMSDTLVTAQSLKERMLKDDMIPDQQTLCRLYANLFINTYQSTEFWHQEEYDTFGDGGCSEYDPSQFKQ